MIRGFVAGVAWGGLVAGVGLAVISQMTPRPLPPVEAVVAGADASSVLVAPPVETAAQAPVVAPAAKPASVSPDPVTQAPAVTLPAVPQPVATPAPPDPVAAAAPEVIAAVEAPVAIGASGADASPAPGLSALVEPGSAGSVVPDAQVLQDLAPVADPAPAVTPDVPLPAPEDALLVPAPAPTADPAPARIAPDPDPVAKIAPAPGTPLPVPDAAPDLPAADLPAADPPPAPAPDIAVAEPEVPSPQRPEPGLETVKPIIAADAPSTLAPDPGLPEAAGVKIGRLPKIGAAEDPAANADPADATPLQRFARAFENPDEKPLFAILLRDTGEANLDRAALAKISFPVTFVLDPLQPGAAEAEKVYRRGGQEVLMLASGIPEGATPGDLEQTFQSLSSVLPEAVGVIDQAVGGFQGNRPLAAQMIPILSEQGRGLVTFDAGLNAADQEARRAALPSTMIFRRLDAEGEQTPVIRRYLDRAAFKAAQEGSVVVLGDTRPETVAALLAWAVEGRAASVALAPITAVLAIP